MAESRPRFAWDQRIRRFRDAASGRLVREDAVLRALRDVSEAQGRATRALGERLLSGDLSLAEWQAQMAQAVKQAHVAGAMAAKGGRQHMTPSDWGAVGANVKRHYVLLRQFAEQIASWAQPPNGHVASRSQNYGRAAWGAYQAMAQRAARQAGESEERNVLGAAEAHCAGCLTEQARGWVPVGELVPPGSRRPCGSLCKCTLRFRSAMEAAA